MKKDVKKKIVSIVQVIILLVVGVLMIYVVTGQIRKPADADSVSLSGESTATDQQMAASEKTDDQEAPKVTKQPEATAAPTVAPKESEKEQPTAESEATAAPTEATKQPGATAAPTATPKTTKQPEATAVPTATPKATKQPGASATPTATPKATKQPTGTSAPAATEPPAQVHTCTWDGGSVTQAASCSNEGVKTYTCTSCGKTKTESIAKTDHSYVTETTPATCTEYGQDRTYCSVCGYEKSKAANSDAPKGHQATDYRVSFGSMGSTCTHPGTYDLYCSVCGACVQREVPREPLGHDLQNPVVIQTASCTAVEITQYTCGKCGELVEEVTRDMDYQNHDWEEGVEMQYNWETDEYDPVPCRWCNRCSTKEYSW